MKHFNQSFQKSIDFSAQMCYNIIKENRTEMITMPKDMTLNRQSKNSVFVDFFNDKATVLQMYKELHP
jgi:hypothetical protein